MEPTTTTVLVTFILALVRETYRNFQSIKEKKKATKQIKPAGDVPPVIKAMVDAYSKSIETLQAEKQALSQDVLNLQMKLRDAEIEIIRLRRDTHQP